MIDATNSAFEQMDEDLSILQQSLQTAFVGFQEAKRAFEDGTDEVRRLLLFECSLIYECNICRNLFRSLANFISHKRAYCCGKVGVTGNHKGFTDHNSAVILQTSESDAANKRSRSTGSSPAPDSSRQSSVKGSTRNICRVIERLKREKAESNGESKHEDTVLHLERVPTSTNAVYQTVKRLQEDSIKTEIDEVHSLLTNVKTVVGPDGKAFTKHTYTAGDNDAINSSSENLGNLGFQTNKTLQMHLEKKHNDLTYVYQCPACSQTFMKSAHVIRHLANEHKKSPRRIRMMREGIMKKRMRKCDVPVKGQNRELKRLQMSNDGAKSAPQHAAESSSKWKVMSSCIYCDVKFERRAALSAHLLKCIAKREATGSKQCLTSAPPAAVKPKLELNNFYCNDVAEFTAAAIEQPFLGNTFKQEPVDANELNEMFANLQTVNNGIGLQTISLERLELSDSNDSIESCATHNTSVQSTSFRSIKSEPLFDSTDNNLEEQKVAEELANENEEGDEGEEDEQQDCVNESNGEGEKASKKTKKTKIKRLPQSEKLTTCRCKICNKQFNAVSNLRRHISMYHYRARRFGCKMCDYHAFRIYDIVNHLVFVHKMTENRDTLAKEFVARHELTYSKKDTDGDIILVSDENVLIKGDEEIMLTKIKCEKTEETAVEEEQPKLFKTYERRKDQEESLEIEVSVDNTRKSTKVAPSDVKLTRSALKRNSSSEVVGDADIPLKFEHPKTIDKRPMRKRIKPINNDFVYDMSSVLKKDMQAPETGTGTRLTRRRLTVIAAVDRAVTVSSGTLKNLHTEKPNTPSLLPLVNHENRESIRTATQRILRRVVSEARGALSTMPDLPTERPQMRPRLTSTYQDEIQSGPIIDANDLEAARRKATLLDDAFLDKFTSRTSSSNTGGASTFKIKPCLELQHDTLNTLLERMDSNKNAALQILNKSSVESYTSANAIANTNLINCSPPPPAPAPQLLNTAETHTNATMLHCSAEEELTEAALATSNHLTDLQTPNGKRCSVHGSNAMTTPRTPPPTPRKRFTLLQHLAENKQRKVDSLLRSALQN